FSTQASGNYAGQTIRLRFRSTNDATLNTNFFLDTCDPAPPVPRAGPPQAAPTISRLSRATPNPTREGTRLRLDLAAPGLVRVGIYDLQGRLGRRVGD